MQERFLTLFDEVLEKENGSTKMENRFRDYEEWDSLAVLSFVAMVDEEYGITIPREDFQKCQTVEDLYNYILQKTGN